MEIVVILIPVSLFLGGIGLAMFFWTMRNDQYDDPKGDAERILREDFDDHPRAD